MKKARRENHVLMRGRPTGAITQRDIERRARELALIRTGTPAFAAEDLAAARRELLGGRDPAGMTDDEEAARSLSRDPSDPAAVRGRQADENAPPDENTAAEELTLQGVDEAQHDQMVEDRERRRQEGS